ncbi:MAG: TIGR01212 family radical SAM protein [Desulfuromonadia bacterium]
MSHLHPDLRINSYGYTLRRRFGLRVSKVNVDAGFTCPNRDGSRGVGGCIYCDNASFSPPTTIPLLSIEEQFHHGAAWHRRRLGSQKFIVYFQKHTNTYAPVDRLEQLYRRALSLPDVIGISIGTRPDAITDDVVTLLTRLSREHFVTLELGLQSIDDRILSAINRGHTVEEYLRAVERLAGRDIELCTHLIIGFPQESPEIGRESAAFLNDLPIRSVKLHQLHVVRGTHLEELYENGSFTPLTLEQYLERAADFLTHLRPDIAIQRLYGSAPLSIRVAPQWGLKNNQMWYAVINHLKEKGLWQGIHYGGGG